MGQSAYRWMMTAANAPLSRAEFDPFPPPAGEVVVEIAGCGVCHTDLGYLYDGVRLNHALPLDARPRDQRQGGGSRQRGRGLARQERDRPCGAAVRRVRALPPRPRHHLPPAEDARQRHPRRLREPRRRAGARTLPGRRDQARGLRSYARRGVGHRRRGDHALPGREARRGRARQSRGGRRQRRGRLLRGPDRGQLSVRTSSPSTSTRKSLPRSHATAPSSR